MKIYVSNGAFKSLFPESLVPITIGDKLKDVHVPRWINGSISPIEYNRLGTLSKWKDIILFPEEGEVFYYWNILEWCDGELLSFGLEGKAIQYLDKKSGKTRRGIITKVDHFEGRLCIMGSRGKTIYRRVNEISSTELDYE